jgi:hypothetical protein
MRIEMTVEIAERPDRPPTFVRLRRWLKVGLRAYGVKVVSAKPNDRTEARR